MKQCPFCAETIQTEAIKCRYCGERLPSVQNNVSSTPTDQPPRKTKWLRVSLVIFGVVALYWGMMLWSAREKQNNQTANRKPLFTVPADDEAKTQRGIALLIELHQSFLDSGYDLQPFTQKTLSVTDELLAITNSMPAGDSRKELLLNALVPYQQAVLRRVKDEEATALAVTGGIRRAGLEKILDGTLTQKQRKDLLLVWPEHKELIMQSKKK